ncbi:hypothetical protein QYE76_014649 [Lolium multiflorum]|uniref:CCHC-type domain-containing protein n=1 Tax=Lolium multiflorum TaxID=4521 RepID=A0AAD8X8D4_LOLMU|nr:hypothetical protein QYE76_014649 [Lolium multiflorum]
MSEREGEREGERGRGKAAAAAGPMQAPGAPTSPPASESSMRPVVSGLGLSGSSSSPLACASSGRSRSPAAAAPVQGRRVQDRLEWIQPRMSRKAKWRRRKSLRRQQAARQSPPREVSPGMAGRCFKCLRPGHPKRECKNEQVCYRCGEEGHGTGGCKRPRSPDSEEVLRQKAMALVDRRFAARRGTAQPGTRGQGAPAVWQPGASDRRAPAVRGPAPAAQPSSLTPPSSAGSWEAESVAPQIGAAAARRLELEPCIVRRTPAMDDLERKLDCALIVYVGGSRPAVSCAQVADALVQRAGIPRAAFTVHRFRPEDFLVVFAAPELLERVASRPSLPYAFFTLFFRRWTRQAQASRVAMRSKLQLVVEGVPAHAWEKDVVQQLVGSSCSLDRVAPETASRDDLGCFRAEAWSVDPESVPAVRDLWVPEPAPADLGAGSSRQPRVVQRARELGLLKYRVLIHIARIEEFVGLEAPAAGPAGAPDARRRDGTEPGGEEGFWTSRALRWTLGVPDRRGGGAGPGAAWGRTAVAAGGPLQWKLPHLDTLDRPAQRIPEPGRGVAVVDGTEQGDRAAFVQTSDPKVDVVGAQGQEAQPLLLDGLGIGAPATDGTSAVAEKFPSSDVGILGERALQACVDVEASAPLVAPAVEKGQLTTEVGEQRSLTAVETACQDQLVQDVGPREDVAEGVREVSSEPLAGPGKAFTAMGLTHDEEQVGPGRENVRVVNGTEYIQITLSEGQSLNSGSQEANNQTVRSLQDDLDREAVDSEGSADSSESLISLHGPDENMQGRVMDSGMRANMSLQEEAALGRMRRFCASILKKLAPPLLREIESSTSARLGAQTVEPRRVTRAAATGSTPAARRPRKATAAEAVLLKALGISEAELDVSDEAIAEFRALFDSPVREQHLRAMAAIFGKTMPDSFNPLAGPGAVLVQ